MAVPPSTFQLRADRAPTDTTDLEQPVEPEWRDDPTARHQLRWFDGERWTDHVADGQDVGTDPYAGAAGASTDWPAPSAGDRQAAGYGGSSETASSGMFSSPQEQPRRGVRVGWVVAIAVVAAIVSGAVGFFIGLAVGASSTFLEGFEGEFDPGFEDGFLPDDEALAAAETAAPLELGGTVAGTADDAGGAHALTLDADTAVELTVTEGDFDTELLVFDDAGLVVASDDDGGDEFLSRLLLDLAPGEYQAVVRPLSGSGPGGDYVLEAVEQ